MVGGIPRSQRPSRNDLFSGKIQFKIKQQCHTQRTIAVELDFPTILIACDLWMLPVPFNERSCEFLLKVLVRGSAMNRISQHLWQLPSGKRLRNYGKVWINWINSKFLWEAPQSTGYLNTYDNYPLVNCYITMENHHFSWVNPLFLWPFSIAILT